MHRAEAVLFDQALSPAQQRNLERHLGVAVADRTMLILEIFGERAQSHEGKLQVELARLQYLSTRLVRRWSHLERQRGGIGGRGGPGEAQIELDRRMIGERIKAVKKRLERVKRQRSTQRRARERNQTFRDFAGRLHQRRQVDAVQCARQGAQPMPPTSCSRRWTRRRGSCASRAARARCRCPTPSASSATCRTSWSRPSRRRCRRRADADLLLHVVDCASPLLDEQMAEVQRVLVEIGAATSRRCWCSTRSTGSRRPSARARLRDRVELPSGRAAPRASSSARAPAKAWTSCAVRGRCRRGRLQRRLESPTARPHLAS